MNLVPAIKQMEEQISELERDCAIKIDELNAGIVALRKLNTVCEACNGEGKRLRIRALRAAAELGRNSYGFEISREFYNKAKELMLKDYLSA